MDVFHPNDTFHFEHLQLTHPQHITGGSYMTRFSYYDSKQPLYIQTTKTQSKQGIVISGKKAYIDLLLTGNEADTEFTEWIGNLEKRSVELLYEKRHLWFAEELDHTDIENSFVSPIRAYKTGSFLLRVNLEPNRNFTHIQPFSCKVFDETKKVASFESIKAEQTIISIIEFHGIKFTSRNFQIELLLRQVLVTPDVPLFETCIISATSPPAAVAPPVPAPASDPAPPTTTKTTPIEETNPDYLGLVSANDGEKENNDRSDEYITPRAQLKHFEFAEVDIDFNNISDTIDINEPIFDTPPTPPPTPHTPPLHPPKTAITLKKHKDVLYEMYKIAKHKAYEMKRAAMRAYLEAKEIKARYLLDDLDDYSSDDDSNK